MAQVCVVDASQVGKCLKNSNYEQKKICRKELDLFMSSNICSIHTKNAKVYKKSPSLNVSKEENIFGAGKLAEYSAQVENLGALHFTGRDKALFELKKLKQMGAKVRKQTILLRNFDDVVLYFWFLDPEKRKSSLSNFGGNERQGEKYVFESEK
eukprot:Sdes_comp16262_c0_seq4m5566